MSVKIAQRRGVWNTLKENTNLLGGVEEFIKPSFREDMNILREQDTQARPMARQAKENLKKADSYLRAKEYILCAVELENFYATLFQMFEQHLNPIVALVDKKYNEMLTENLDDSHYDTLSNRKRANDSSEMIKKEALLDWVKNMFNGRRRGISHLEKNYGHFKELSAGMRLHLRNAISLYEVIKAKFSVMAAARAERNIPAYVRAAKTIREATTEKKKSYDIFFDKNVQPFVEILKQKKALQEIENAKREKQDAIEKEEAIQAENQEAAKSQSPVTSPTPEPTKKKVLNVPLQEEEKTEEEFSKVSPEEISYIGPNAGLMKVEPTASATPPTPPASSTPAASPSPSPSAPGASEEHAMPPQLAPGPEVHEGELMPSPPAAPAEELEGEVVPSTPVAALPAAKPATPAQHAKARPSQPKKPVAPKPSSTTKKAPSRKPAQKTSADHAEFLSKIATISDEKLLLKEILAYSESVEDSDSEMSLQLLSIAEGLIAG